MPDRICYIFAAGDFFGNFKFCDNDLIIAADAGYRHLESLGIKPDILLGDFDSIGIIPDVADTVTFPTHKDFTDTQLAIEEGVKRGFTNFIVCGALGGKRLEHTISNIQTMVGFCERGLNITLTDGLTIVKAIHNSSIEIDEMQSGFISVFCFSGSAKGVCLEGLKYPLNNAELYDSMPLGVSNEFIGMPSKISVKRGTLVVMWNQKLF